MSDAPKHLIRTLSALSVHVVVDAGHVLFEQGDGGDAMFLIESGALEISVVSLSGRKLSLDVLRSGDVLGEIALFDQGPRTATVTALRASRLGRIRSADVYAAIGRDPALARDLMRLAGRQLRRVNMQLHEQVFLPLGVRLARKLLHLTDPARGSDNRLEMAQSDLAEFVGATRESVSKTLAGWRRDGIVEISRSALIVRDRSALYLVAMPGSI
ncbi:MAG: Crp/Fnr family transcriptional regulator [Pseudomonadota bacterium]